MTGKLRLDFENLPLVEAAVRASFNGPKALSYSLINSIHADLKPSFPALTESTQLEFAPGTGGTQFEIGTGYLPGAVYTGHAAGLSVHVQPQVIVARWSKRPGLTEPKYTRYQALRDALWNTVEAFRKGCGDDFPGIAVVNMSYVNFIPASNAPPTPTTYFSKEAHLRIMGNARHVRKLEAAWAEDEDLDVRFALEQAATKFTDRVEQGHRLTTAAGLRLTPSVDAQSGLDKVHNKLQEFFLELISDEAKKEWRFQERSNAGAQ